MTLLKSLGLSSPDQSKSDALADLVDATNTEQGITALGDALPISSTPSQQPELDQSIKDIFAQDTEEDYLVLPNAQGYRPRSKIATHTIGCAIITGSTMGAIFAAIKNFTTDIRKPAIRSEYLTQIVRSMRNNSIRFGTFTVLMCGTGIAMESYYDYALNQHLPDEPTEEEFYQMQMKGIQWEPPKRTEVPPETQQQITTSGIFTGGIILAIPKAWDLLKQSRKFQGMDSLMKEAGVAEKAFLKYYGTKSGGIAVSDKLPRTLRFLAIGRILGAVAFCYGIDRFWRSQNEAINRTVKNTTSQMDRMF